MRQQERQEAAPSAGSMPVRRSAEELMNRPLRPVSRCATTTGCSMVSVTGGRSYVLSPGYAPIHRTDRLQQLLDRFGQSVVGGLQIRPQGASAHLGDDLVRERLDVERGIAPCAPDVPRRGAARLVEVEHIDQPVVIVAEAPQRMVERFVEDLHRPHVRIGREVLVTKHEDLVVSEVVA